MNDYTKNIQFMDNMIARMKELGIDLYLIITGEGADPIPGTCFGVDTVGSSAYAFTSRETSWLWPLSLMPRTWKNPVCSTRWSTTRNSIRT